MSFVKKHIRFLFIVGICLQSLPTKSAQSLDDLLYGPFVGTQVEDVAAVGNGFSEMIIENPKIIIGSAITAMGAGIVFAVNKYGKAWRDNLKKEIDAQQKNVAQATNDAQETVLGQMSLPVRKALMFLVNPIIDGGRAYLWHNKYHLVLSGASAATGYFAAQQLIGYGLAGIVAAAGYMRQGYYELKGEIVEFRAENNQMHAEGHKKIDAVSSKVDGVSTKISALEQMLDATKLVVDETNINVTKLTGKVDEATIEVRKDIGNFKAEMSTNIKDVNTKLVTLNEIITKVPQQILDLNEEIKVLDEERKNELKSIKETNSEIIGQNNAIVRKIKEVSQQLESATDKLGSTEEQVNQLGKDLVQQMRILAQDTKEQVESIKLGASDQAKNLESLKSDVQDKFQALSNSVESSGEMLATIKNVQTSHDGQLALLLSKTSDNEQKNDTLLAKLVKIQEDSAASCSSMVQDLNMIRQANTQSFNDMNLKMASIESIIVVEQKEREKLQVTIANQGDQITNLSVQLLALQGQMNILNKKMDKNNKLAKETNSIAKQATGLQNLQMLPAPSGDYVTIADDASYPFPPQRNAFSLPKAPVKPFSQGPGISAVLNRGKSSQGLLLAPGQPR